MDDWEGKVNVWLFDEGLIDYVDVFYGGVIDENVVVVLNVIVNSSFIFGGEIVDVLEIIFVFLEDIL